MLSAWGAVRVNSGKDLAAHRERSFAALRMTSDPRLLPILVGKNHNRPLQLVCLQLVHTPDVAFVLYFFLFQWYSLFWSSIISIRSNRQDAGLRVIGK